MLIRTFIFILSIQLLVPAYAQEKCKYFVEGHVYDIESLEPLPYASVIVEDTEKGTSTDSLGYFRISGLCSPEFNIKVSYIGYKSTVHHHDEHHDTMEIYLVDDHMHLQGIIVEGLKESDNFSTITKNSITYEDLEEYRTEGIAEIASRITGVGNLKTGQNVSKPIIHGLSGNRILIVNNGLVFSNQNWGPGHAPEIESSFTRDIEIIKGAGTVRYGPEALGGVMLIKYPKPELSQSFSGDFTVSGETNGRGYHGLLSMGKGGENVSWQAMASYNKRGDRSAADYLLTNTGMEEAAFSFGTLFHKGPLDLEVDMSFIDQDLGILRSSVSGSLNDLIAAIDAEQPLIVRDFSYQINNPRQATQHLSSKVKSKFNLEDQFIEFQYGLQSNVRTEFDIRRGTLNEIPSIDLKLMTHSADLDWVHPEFYSWFGRIGLQWSLRNNENVPGTNTLPLVPNFIDNRFGVYFIEKKDIPKGRIEFGLRYDYQSVSISGRDENNELFRGGYALGQFTGSFGYKRDFSEHSEWQMNLGTAWRPPNISELFSFGKHGASIEYGLMRYQQIDNRIEAGVGAISAQNITTEKGAKLVNRFRHHSSKSAFEVVNYYHIILDYVNSIPAGITNTVRGAFPYFVYRQNDAFLWGLDIVYNQKIRANLNSDFRFSYLWSKDITNNSFFVGQPPMELSNRLKLKLPQESSRRISFHVDNRYVFRQFQAPEVITPGEILNAQLAGESLFDNVPTFDFMEVPDGYYLLDMGISMEIGKIHTLFSVYNLLNQSYRVYTDRLRYFSDFTGRNIRLSVEYNF